MPTLIRLLNQAIARVCQRNFAVCLRDEGRTIAVIAVRSLETRLLFDIAEDLLKFALC